MQGIETLDVLFEKQNIIPLHSQYIFPLSTFAGKNKDAFKCNSAIHSINTKTKI
jgi:hypothetical protein